jgi:D-alanyl-D-alanine carboxypeptidase (penicillin-binding protein 5/6)
VPPPPQIQGKAWVLMDYATGQVIAGDNENERVEPASITKVMTSYVVAAEMKAGKVKGDDQVMMSEHAWREGGAGTEGSYSGFEVNKTAPLVEMEKGMVIQSGNDAAIALAEHVAGSEDAFAALMNAYAARIGMKGSHFVNPHGLSAPDHYSTAHDLAILGRAMVRDFPERIRTTRSRNTRSARSRSRTATCCCGATRRSTASRPATTAARATA